MNIDIDFEENSPHQEGIISKLYQRPNKTYFQETKDLESLSKYKQPHTKVFAKTSRYR